MSEFVPKHKILTFIKQLYKTSSRIRKEHKDGSADLYCDGIEIVAAAAEQALLLEN